MSQRFPARSARKLSRRLRRHPGRFKAPAFILSTAAALMLPQLVKADTLFWDPDGNSGNPNVGGEGIWNTTSAFWDTAPDGNNQAWVNKTPTGDDARFLGTPGQVRLGVPITVRTMDFAVPGYSLVSEGNNPANTLTLAGFDAGFLLQSGRLEVNLQILGTDGLRVGDTTPNEDGLSGTLALTNPNNLYTGVTTISGRSVIETNNLPNLGEPSSIGRGGPAYVTTELGGLDRNLEAFIRLDGGTLSYNGNGTGTNRTFEITNLGGGIDSSGTGASLGFSTSASGVKVTGSGARTFTLSGTNIAYNSIASPIGNPTSGALSVVKSGPGTWVMGGGNIYTGSTTINGGTLIASLFSSQGAASSIGAGDNIPQNLVLNGGTLLYTGPAGQADRSFSIGPNGGRIESSGTGALTFGSNSAVAATGSGDRTLTLGGVVLDNIMRTQITDPTSAWILTGANTMARINAGSPEVFEQSVTINGLVAGENLHSIDFDPKTGKLYAMGTTANGQTNRIYEVNIPAANATTTTVEPTSTATVTGLNVGITATNYGFDFDPVTGLIHLTTNTDGNYTFAKDGTGLVTNTSINPAAPTIVGLAYSNNVPTALSTILYGIDSGGDNLVTIDPTSGLVTTIGSLDSRSANFNVNDASGLDIAANGAAFAMLNDGSFFRLVTINLLNGDGSIIGTEPNPVIGGFGTTTPPAVRDLAVTVSGKTSLVKTGPGSWTLDRAGKHMGNTYTGTTTINQGRLTLNFNLADTPDTHVISPQSPLIMSGGMLAITGKNPTGAGTPSDPIVTYNNVQTLNGLTLTPGGSFIAPSSGTGESTLQLNLGALASRPSFATLAFQPAGTTTITMTAANVNGILGPWATYGGTDWARMNGTTVEAFAGYTPVALGTAIADGSNHVSIVNGMGNVTLGATTTTINTLQNVATNTDPNAATATAILNNAGRTLRLGEVGGILTGNQPLTIGTSANSGTLTAGGPNINTPGELILHNNSTTLLTINSVIANNGSPAGAVSVVNAGSGITVLNGVNTYTGNTVLNGGQLFIGDNRALSTSTVVVNSSVTPVVLASSSGVGREIANNFILNSDLGFVDNRTSGATGLGGLVIRGTINLTGGERIITVNQANGYVTLDGTITNGALVKSGPGSLAFNDLALTNVSSITLAQGSLDIWSPVGLANTPINVLPGSTGALSASGGLYKAITSNIFLGGNLTLGRPQLSEGIDLGGFIDLSNSTLSNPRIISTGGTLAQLQQRLSDTIVNGALGKGGTGELVVSSNTSTFEGGTTIFASTAGSTLRVTADGRLGANVLGNDIYVGQDPSTVAFPLVVANSFATLRLDSIASLGDKQAIILSNFRALSTPVLAWGSAFDANPDAVGFVNYLNGTLFNTGLKNIRIDTGFFGEGGPVSIAVDGVNTGINVIGKVLEGVPNASVWLGATLSNGVYSGDVIATGFDATYRLGGGGGTLTIAKANVLTGPFHNVIVGSYDQTGRGITGTVFLPQAQDFGGILVLGAGTTLVAGVNGALGTNPGPIYLRGGILNLRSTGAHHSTDSQYVGRDFAFYSTSTMNIDPLGGGQMGRVEIGGLDFSEVANSTTFENVAPAAPTFVTNISNNFELRVTRPVTLISNLPATPSASVTNTFQVNSGFLSIDAPIGQTDPLVSAGANFQKSGSGTLILSQPMTHTGLTIANGGTMVLTATDIVPGPMRLTSGVLSLRSNSATPAVYDFNRFEHAGAGTIFVGPISPIGIASYSGTQMEIPNIAPPVGAAAPAGLTVNGTLNSSLRVRGTTAIGANFTMTVNAARTEFGGDVVGVTGATNFSFTKAGIGTLILSGRNVLTGATTITQGTIVANHDQAGNVDTFGSGVLSFTGASSGALLIAGGRILTRSIALDSIGGTQVLGGYDATGAKTFSGGIALSTAVDEDDVPLNNGVVLTAETGSTVNFNGVISGGGTGAVTIGSLSGGVLLPIAGTPALGRGTIVLNPSGVAGNTFTIPLVVNNGTLIGKAQATAATSPFGANNAITLNHAVLQVDGRASNTNTSHPALNVGGGGSLVMNDPNDAFETRFSVGSLTRAGNGTLTLSQSNNGVVNVTNAPALVNGILPPWMVRTGTSGGDFLALNTGNLALASYTSGNLDVATSTSVFSANSGSTLTADRAVYAFKTSTDINLSGKTLRVGDSFATGAAMAGAAGGVILNNGANINSGTLDFGQAEGVIYVDQGTTSTIGAAITGTAGLVGVGLTDVRTATVPNSQRVVTSGSNILNGLPSTARLQPGAIVTGAGIPANAYITAILSPTSVQLSANATSSSGTGASVPLTFNSASSLTKTGTGTLILGHANNYRGNTVIQEGTLRMGAVNAVGLYTNNALLVASNVALGSRGALDLNGFNTEIGALSGAFGSVVNLGNARLTTGRAVSTANLITTFSGQLLGGANSALQKIGPGTLILDNTRADASASTFNGSIFVDQGTLVVVIADQTNGTPYAVGNSLASAPTITLRGGTLSLRTSGDNVSGSNQNMMGRYNIVVDGATGILDPTRFGTTETQKTIELGKLTLGVNEFQITVSTGATVVPAFMDTVTLTDNARINTNNAELSISGVITDNGQGFTLNKVGGNNLFIFNANNDYSGGTIVAGGNLFFGARGPDVMRFAGNSFVPNDSGRAGTGPIVLETNTVINFTDVENLGFGQTVRLLSGSTSHGSASGFVIQTDRDVSKFNLRTLGRGSLQIGVQTGTYATPIDLSKIGNAEWGLSSGRSVETLYTAPTLGAGAGNVVRFYGSSGSAFVVMGQNAISGSSTVELGRSLLDLGTNPGQSNSSIRFMLAQDYTGKTLIHRNANAAGPANALLDFRGTLASGTSASNPIEVYGRLAAIGAGTFTNSEVALNNVNTNILLRPGSELALDYNTNANNGTPFLVPLGTTSATGFLNKWGDEQPIVLDGATLRVTSAPSALTTEVIGAVTYKGAAEIFPQSAGTGGNSAVIINGPLTRVNLGTMAFRSTSGQLGVSGEPGTTAGQRVVFKTLQNAIDSGATRGVVADGPKAGTVIRMVSPRFFSNTANTFVDYDPNTVLGFSDVPFVTVNSSSFNGGVATDGTQIVDHVTTAVSNVSNGDFWALRTGVTIGNSGDYANSFTIRSGGLAITAGVEIFPKLNFKNGPAIQEADIWTVAAGSTVTLRGKITANNLVKTGPETLAIVADNTVSGGEGLTGSIQVNGGTLVLGGTNPNPADSSNPFIITASQALGNVTSLRLHAGNFNNASNQMPQVTLLSNGTATYGQSITVSQFVPFATINVDRINSGSNASLIVAGGLTIEGGGSDGTVLAFTNGNDFDFTSSGPVILGLASPGEPGTAPIGINVTNNNGTNNVMFLGRVSGPSSQLVKSGNGPLILANNATGVTGNAIAGITINDGTLQLRNGELGSGAATGFQAAGTGSILLNRGILELFGVTNNANHANLDTNNVTIAGHGILAFNRPTAAATTLLFGGTNATLTTQNSANIQVNTSTTVSGQWAGKTVINDSPTFNLASTTLTLGNASAGDSITGTGHIYKTGNNVLVFNSGANTNTLSGGIDIFQGQVRIATTTTETFGTGPIRISPSGILGVTGTANVSSNTQVANFHSNSTSFAGLALRTSGLLPGSFLNSSNITTAAGNGGLLAIDVANYSATLPNQSAVFDGAWFYGSTIGGTYSGASFAAGANDTYRIGGGGNTLTISGANVLRDTVGEPAKRAIFGKPHGLTGNGVVVLSNTAGNSYTGGTTISRVRDAAGNFTVTQVQARAGYSASSFGTGAVDVFGNVIFEGTDGAATSDAGGNRNTFTFHPGSRLRLSNATAYSGLASPEGRWADSVGIALRSSSLEMIGFATGPTNDQFNSEMVGGVTFSGGSEIQVSRGTGTQDTQLYMSSLARQGSGTLTISHTANALGAVAFSGGGFNGGSSELVSINDRSGLIDANGVVKPFIVSRTENNFLFYDANTDSLRVLTQALATANSIPYTLNAATTISLNNPAAILDNNAAATLSGVVDVYALRLQQDLSTSTNGQFNTITIRSGGLTLGSAARTITANLNFGTAASPVEALIHASAANLTINGMISAAGVTKFGTSSLTINQDQPLLGPSTPWNVNQGQLIVQTPGGLGTAPVFLNGWSGNNTNGQLTTELRLNFNPGTPEELRFTSGKITALDMNLIQAQTAVDRTVRIADLDLKTTNAVPGTGIPGLIRLQVSGLRSQMRTGAITMFDDYVMQIDATNNGPGSTISVRPDSINNRGNGSEGPFNLTKIGDALLILGDNASTFVGGTITVNEGGVKVLSNGSFGTGTTAIIDNGGALEIATPNFTPVGTLIQRSGSIERWSVNNARGGAEVNIGDTNNRGVHLQVAYSQTGTKTINLWGGSIMGYLPIDLDEIAVFHSLGSDISVKLKTDSMVGQPYPAGTNVVGGSVNHIYYDMGKQNQMNNPMNPILQGSVLDIRGTISGELGTETLTKVGMDVVQFSGNNNVGNGFNTTVREGMLVLGSSNALPATKSLNVTNSGAVDLNGFDATTGSLSGVSTNAVIANSATTINTLTVNGSGSYAGGLAGGLEFKYAGGGTFTLSGNHTHFGATTVENNSTLVLTGSASGSLTYKVAGGSTLNVANANGSPNSFQVLRGQTLSGGDTVSMGTAIGTVQGTVAVKDGALLAPGFELGGIGRLQINGNLNLESGARFKLELAGNALGQYDQLIVTGNTLNLGGATLDGTVAFGSVQVGQVYYIAIHDNASATTGTFAGLTQNELFMMSGYEFQISYTADSTLGDAGFANGANVGNDVALLVTIPEPSSLTALCAGFGTLLGLRRFRRRVS